MKQDLSFNITNKLSKFLDKNYFIKVRDFDSNNNINYILSNNLKKFNPILTHDFNIFFNENNIKTYKIDIDKIFFQIEKYMFNLYFIDQEFFRSKKEYMDYNCGLLLNNILSIFNLKYNYEGLFYIYNKRNVFNDLKITKTQEKIFNLLSLDYNIYKHGFNSENDLFKWLIECPYINTEKILTNKKLKNKLFLEFKNYIKNNNIINIPEIQESILLDQVFHVFNNESSIKEFIKNNENKLKYSYGR